MWCHFWVPLQCALVGGEGDDQLWGSGRGAISGCHCSVLWLGGRVTTNFGGVDVVPLITQKLVFAIWRLCWYNFSKGLSMHRKYHGFLHFFTSGSQSKPAKNTGIYSVLTRQHAKNTMFSANFSQFFSPCSSI